MGDDGVGAFIDWGIGPYVAGADGTGFEIRGFRSNSTNGGGGSVGGFGAVLSFGRLVLV